MTETKILVESPCSQMGTETHQTIFIDDFSQPHRFTFPNPGPRIPTKALFSQALQARDTRTVSRWLEGSLGETHPLNRKKFSKFLRLIASRPIPSFGELDHGESDSKIKLFWQETCFLFGKCLSRYKSFPSDRVFVGDRSFRSLEIDFPDGRVASSIAELFGRFTGTEEIEPVIQLIREMTAEFSRALFAACSSGNLPVFSRLREIAIEDELPISKDWPRHWLRDAIVMKRVHMYGILTLCSIDPYKGLDYAMSDLMGSSWESYQDWLDSLEPPTDEDDDDEDDELKETSSR